MKTITETFPIYRFSELSESAKQRAKDEHANLFGYAWADDSLMSIQALAKYFGGKLSDYSIDYFNASYSSLSFKMPEMEAEAIEAGLSQLGSFDPETLKGLGDCVLTGFCMDESAIDGFRAAWNDGERDLEKLMEAAGESWLEAVHDDCADQYSDATFEDFCEANDYEFLENGTFYAK